MALYIRKFPFIVQHGHVADILTFVPTKVSKSSQATSLAPAARAAAFLVVCETRADRRHCRAQTVLDDPGNQLPATDWAQSQP